MSAPVIYSIGHSNHATDVFLGLLHARAISAIADVRTAPYSRRLPQFGREALAGALGEAGIAYVWLGRELGGLRDFAAARATPEFAAGIERLIQGAARHRIAMMCAEKDPADCHRAQLVAPALVERGVTVLHMLADGALEDHRETARRLKSAQGSLFA